MLLLFFDDKKALDEEVEETGRQTRLDENDQPVTQQETLSTNNNCGERENNNAAQTGPFPLDNTQDHCWEDRVIMMKSLRALLTLLVEG
mmetsp:Transcript_7886/g.21983  ORF Transcript_7886/g.21983 Transcript_7886/m.21983 type:complete len:89 (-) Transcript_7886:1737-2003(-)